MKIYYYTIYKRGTGKVTTRYTLEEAQAFVKGKEGYYFVKSFYYK